MKTKPPILSKEKRSFDQENYCNVWGDQRIRYNRMKFQKWLAGLDDASPFLKSRRALSFYKGLSQPMRAKILAWLRKVNPQELKRLRRVQLQTARQMRKEREFVPVQEIRDTTVALREVVDEVPGVSTLRFMDIGGLKGVIAIALAAGYKRREVADLSGMALEDLNSLVTRKDVVTARHRLPNAIIEAADQKVMRDLLAGAVTEDTARADLIANRRKKLLLEKRADDREEDKLHEEVEKIRERRLKERFGVDRKSGKTIETEAVKEEEDEDS